eukprot:2204281-Amphidinium_carterae.1
MDWKALRYDCCLKLLSQGCSARPCTYSGLWHHHLDHLVPSQSSNLYGHTCTDIIFAASVSGE